MNQLTAKYANEKILIIDDDVISNILLENILNNYGFNQIKSINDPRLVSEVFLQYQPDLILLDLEMPHMNGYDVFKKLQRINKKEFLPVIMITMHNDKTNKNRALSLGIQYFIEKPFDKVEILTKIQNILHINFLYKQITTKNKELEAKVTIEINHVTEMQVELIERLLKAVEFRDQETGDHVKRISKLVYIISKNMGLTEKLSADFAEASKLHDIGKISIPDNILLKKGKLNKEEWEVIKTHTLKGEEILLGSNSEILQLSGVIARTHHENWDGTGYPAGLKGEGIPLAGRITALADVFDALLSVRPYKEAWDMKDAINYTKEKSGVKFDPAVVKAFNKDISILKSIYS